MAVKNKILNWKTFINPNRIYSLYNNAQANTQTNIEAWQLPQIINLFKNLNFDKIERYILDDSPGGLLKSITTEDGADVLAPRSGDLAELQEFAQNIFLVNTIAKNNVRVIIANGTTIEGLATYSGSSLESWGFNVVRLVNSPRQDFEKTVIYSLVENNNQEALRILKNRMSANAAKDVPEFLNPLLYQTNDLGEQKKVDSEFLIVVGLDQEKAINAIKEWTTEQARLATLIENSNNEKKN